jgi:hypothetical protein
VGVGIWDRRRVFLWQGIKPDRFWVSRTVRLSNSPREQQQQHHRQLFTIFSCLETAHTYRSPQPDHNTTSLVLATHLNTLRTRNRLSISETILPRVASLHYPRKYQVERDLSLVVTLDKRAHRNLEASPTNAPTDITATWISCHPCWRR